MKTVQKLAIFSSLVALLLSFGSFYLLEVVSIKQKAEKYESIMGVVIVGFVVDLLPALLMSIGTIIHITRKSRWGFITVVVFGAITVVLKGFMLLLVSSFYDYGQSLRILLASAGSFAAVTILIAFFSRKANILRVG